MHRNIFTLWPKKLFEVHGMIANSTTRRPILLFCTGPASSSSSLTSLIRWSRVAVAVEGRLLASDPHGVILLNAQGFLNPKNAKIDPILNSKNPN